MGCGSSEPVPQGGHHKDHTQPSQHRQAAPYGQPAHGGPYGGQPAQAMPYGGQQAHAMPYPGHQAQAMPYGGQQAQPGQPGQMAFNQSYSAQPPYGLQMQAQSVKPQAQIAPMQKVENPPPYNSGDAHPDGVKLHAGSPGPNMATPPAANAAAPGAPVATAYVQMAPMQMASRQMAPAPTVTLQMQTGPTQIATMQVSPPVQAAAPTHTTPKKAASSPAQTAPPTAPDHKQKKKKSDSSDESSDDDSDGSGVVTEKQVKKFIKLERKLKEMEQLNVQSSYDAKKQDLNRLTSSVSALEKKVSDAKAKCAKEKGDVDALTSSKGNASAQYAMNLGDITKEQQEYVAALTELDLAKQELSNTKQALDRLNAELKPLKEKYEHLLDLQDDQDDILDKIFKGAYGSLKENQLEKEVDFLLERQSRIKLARNKWHSSRAYVMEACNQMSTGCKMWTQIPISPQSNDPKKIGVATLARNYFIAAIQNFRFAHSCLSTINFPYCHQSDLSVLDTAIKNVYFDIQLPLRHHQVYNSCYLAMYNRGVGLLRWFDQVLSGTIEKDLKAIDAQVKQRGRELREERVRLMIERLQAQGYTGELPSLKIAEAVEASAPEPAVPEAAVQPIMVQGEGDKPIDTPKADLDVAPPALPALSPDVAGSATGTDGHLVRGDASSVAAAAPSGSEHLAGGGPIPLDKLAPPPSKEDLFGDVQELFTKHAEDMKELERVIDVNRARQEQDLSAKLAARKSRKMRRLEQEQALSAATPAQLPAQPAAAM